MLNIPIPYGGSKPPTGSGSSASSHTSGLALPLAKVRLGDRPKL